MEREPGFYWLHDKETRHQPNPFVAYWSGEDWQFIGSLFIVREDEDNDYGQRPFDHIDILRRADPPQT